ncbi:hypothetical protein TNCV_5031921 [Trichonephila clavipes]|nr:hypothetical protein TNCV_5031921 [Trichonephila clavipes]
MSVNGNARNGCHDSKCPLARCFRGNGMTQSVTDLFFVHSSQDLLIVKSEWTKWRATHRDDHPASIISMIFHSGTLIAAHIVSDGGAMESIVKSNPL